MEWPAAEVRSGGGALTILRTESLGAYVISMAKQASDVLLVHLLQKISGRKKHLRVVPLDSTILYIQPLFLSAQSTGGGGTGQAIPELSQVVVSDGNAVAMDSTLAGAIQDLNGGTAPRAAPAVAAVRGAVLPPATGAGWSSRALQLLDQADRQLRAGDFGGFGASLRQLRDVLNAANRAQR